MTDDDDDDDESPLLRWGSGRGVVKVKGQRCITSGIGVATATGIKLPRDLQEADFRQRRRDRSPARTHARTHPLSKRDALQPQQ